MELRLDILDERLDAMEAADDRERLRTYLDLWRAGEVDPLNDAGVVVIAELGDGSRPLVANDGEGGAPQ